MARFVVPPGWPVPPKEWKPPHGWQPDPEWGPPPIGWSFWQEEDNGQEGGQTASAASDATGGTKKKFLAYARKVQTKSEERIKQATVKTREILQDEQTKATVKRIVEDERTKTIFVTGGKIGLAAARAALTERNAVAAATAAAAEHRRLSGASHTSRSDENDGSLSSNPRTPGSGGPVSTNKSMGSSPSDSGNASSSSPDGSTWSPPTWSDAPRPKAEDRVIQPPVRMLMNESGMFVVAKHPRMPGLFIEATKTDRLTYAIAIEWKYRMQRTFYAAHEIPETWTAIQHDDFFVPMELRRDEAGHVWCRWLEPNKVDREVQRNDPYIPSDPHMTYRTISNALRTLGGGSRWGA